MISQTRLNANDLQDKKTERDDRDLAEAIAELHKHGPGLICELWSRIDDLERHVTRQSRAPKASNQLAKNLVERLRNTA